MLSSGTPTAASPARISRAKSGTRRSGARSPQRACATWPEPERASTQACPANAITFGDLNNPAHAHLYCDAMAPKPRKKNAQRLARSCAVVIQPQF